MVLGLEAVVQPMLAPRGEGRHGEGVGELHEAVAAGRRVLDQEAHRLDQDDVLHSAPMLRMGMSPTSGTPSVPAAAFARNVRRENPDRSGRGGEGVGVMRRRRPAGPSALTGDVSVLPGRWPSPPLRGRTPSPARVADQAGSCRCLARLGPGFEFGLDPVGHGGAALRWCLKAAEAVCCPAAGLPLPLAEVLSLLPIVSFMASPAGWGWRLGVATQVPAVGLLEPGFFPLGFDLTNDRARTRWPAGRPSLFHSPLAAIASIIALACIGSPLALSTFAAASKHETRFSFLGLSALALVALGALAFLPRFSLGGRPLLLVHLAQRDEVGVGVGEPGEALGLGARPAWRSSSWRSFFFFDMRHSPLAVFGLAGPSGRRTP